MNQLQYFINSREELYRAYMPYVQGGGIFIATILPWALREQVRLTIQIPNYPDIYTIDTQVVWKTPLHSQGNKPMGLGLQLLGEQGLCLKNKIESLLKDMLQSTPLTDAI